VPGSIGKCEAVTGPPHGTRTKCADGGGDACKALGCDGSKDRTKCSVYANGLEKECAPASCSAGLETPAAVCDGMGACGTAKPRPCSPYVCDTTKCKVACASNDDCAMGFSCNKTTAQCDPIEASCSDDELSSVPLDKSKPARDCSPYRCNSATGDCNKTCAKSEDCAPGRICDGTVCVDPAAPSDASTEADAGGCAFSSPGKSNTPRLALLLAVALVAARRRRR
jgi:MYXO-CTERM domain-containing protein